MVSFYLSDNIKMCKIVVNPEYNNFGESHFNFKIVVRELIDFVTNNIILINITKLFMIFDIEIDILTTHPNNYKYIDGYEKNQESIWLML